jgi:hypothetical protein
VGKPERILTAVGLAVLLAFGMAAGQEETRLPPSKLMIDQVYVDLPDIDIFLWATDSQGATLTFLDKSKLTLSLDQKPLPLPADATLGLLKDQEEGVAYTILLDVSMSLKAEDLKAAKAAAAGFVEGLRPSDKAMLIRFGSTVEILAPFTGDKDVLRERIESLEPVASNTLLYSAIETAFRQNSVYSPEVPRRRAILVLSDGIDEGSGVSLQDLRELMTFPVYTIGFAGGKKLFIESLVQISIQSGGQYFHITAIPQAEDAYTKIRDFIGAQWHLKLKYCDQEPDNGIRTLEMTLNDVLVLDSKKTVRMYSTKSLDEWKKACGKDVAPVAAGPKKILGIAWYWIAGGGGFLLLAVLLTVLLVARRRKRRREAAEAEAAREAEALAQANVADGMDGLAAGFGAGPSQASPTAPYPDSGEDADAAPCRVSFSVLEGQGKGGKIALPFRRERLRIGRAGLSDFVLDDDEVSSDHATLTREQGFFFLEDNKSRNGVYVNGIRIKTVKRIEVGDIINLGNTKLRFNGEAKPDEE